MTSRVLSSGITVAASSGRSWVNSAARTANTFILARPMTSPKFLSSPRIWFSTSRLILTSRARLTERYQLQIDRQSKRSFKTPEAARSAALEIKSRFPILQVSIYDSVSKSRAVVDVPKSG